MRMYNLYPRDILFFRDARPMGGSAEGAGANWPLPSVLHQALMTAFHDAWPDGVDEESRHHRRDDENDSLFRFGGLRTVGPFPCRDDGKLFIPTPADVVKGGGMAPVEVPGVGNLPAPLRYPVASLAPPTKETPGAWMSLCELRKYLAGEADIQTCEADKLFIAEPRPGVGIDPETHSSRDGIFYQAEYLRMRDGVGMAFLAEAEGKKHGQASGVCLLDKLFADAARLHVVFGGQRGVVSVEPAADSALDIPLPEITGNRVKWILLTPALFNAGWRPGWVGPDGRVMLRQVPDRARFATRRAWREAVQSAPPIGASLVAARIPKAVPASGWKLEVNGGRAGGEPKPTRLLAPAGAVYYFDCDSAEAAQALARQLHGAVKADLQGEKGYGYGACAPWSPHQP